MLAVAGGKGGVGKTTVALGVGAALARRDRETVVVDADRAMPDLGRRAGVEGGAVAAIAAGAPVDAVVRRDGEHSPPVVPATPGTDHDEVHRALTRLRATDRRVVVDCPAGASRDAATPLRVADRTLLVTTTTGPSLRGAVKTAAMARALDAPPVGAIVTMAADASDARDVLDVPVIETTPTSTRPLSNRRVLAAFQRFVELRY